MSRPSRSMERSGPSGGRDRGERGGERGERGGEGSDFRPRRRTCWFCAQGVNYIDYKNGELLGRYIQVRGKITPSRITGTCARHQRGLGLAVKRARQMAILPFVVD